LGRTFTELIVCVGDIDKFHVSDLALNPDGDSDGDELGSPHFDGTPLYSCDLPVANSTNAPAVCACGFPDRTQVDGLTALVYLTIVYLALGSVPQTTDQRLMSVVSISSSIAFVSGSFPEFQGL
jgi:hypothetical protein